MKVWTYLEAKNKVLSDCDLEDEVFIDPNELIGYFNDGLKEAEAEIHTMNAETEYFRTKSYIPFVAGVSKYDLPDNIYANKIVGIMYSNGSIIYPITQFRRRYRYENMIFVDQYGVADEYRYTLFNDIPGQARMEFHPPIRETAILPPNSNSFTPAIMWYMRNCARIPIMSKGASIYGEFCNPEVVAPTQVNTGTNVITVNSGSQTYGVKNQGIVGCYPGSIPYITGDAVMVTPAPGAALPGGLSANTVYFVISLTATTIKLAASLALAQAGTAITLTTTGTTFFTITVAATQNIVNATLLDIPEFTEFVIQWAKCCTYLKELKAVPSDESAKLADQKKQMVDALTLAIPDDDDTVQPDYSHYQEMS